MRVPHLPEQPAEVAIRKLEHRQSYMAKAPYQRKSRRRALSDFALRLCPVTWLGPAIIKAHDKYEYKKDRREKEEVYVEYQVKRKMSVDTAMATRTNSFASLTPASHPPPVSCWKPVPERVEVGGMDDPLLKTRDPWSLPPIEEMI